MPGRKFSITTSLCAARRRNSARPASPCRSSARLRLLRFTVSCMNESGGSEPGRNGGERRAISPAGCSTFTTSAPKSASRQPHIGPAQVVVASSTRTPASGPGAVAARLAEELGLLHAGSPGSSVLQRGRFHREAAMESGFDLGALLVPAVAREHRAVPRTRRDRRLLRDPRPRQARVWSAPGTCRASSSTSRASACRWRPCRRAWRCCRRSPAAACSRWACSRARRVCCSSSR